MGRLNPTNVSIEVAQRIYEYLARNFDAHAERIKASFKVSAIFQPPFSSFSSSRSSIFLHVFFLFIKAYCVYEQANPLIIISTGSSSSVDGDLSIAAMVGTNEACWNDPTGCLTSAGVYGLSKLYPQTLQTFFSRVGVPDRPAPDRCFAVLAAAPKRHKKSVAGARNDKEAAQSIQVAYQTLAYLGEYLQDDSVCAVGNRF